MKDAASIAILKKNLYDAVLLINWAISQDKNPQ